MSSEVSNEKIFSRELSASTSKAHKSTFPISCCCGILLVLVSAHARSLHMPMGIYIYIYIYIYIAFVLKMRHGLHIKCFSECPTW